MCAKSCTSTLTCNMTIQTGVLSFLYCRLSVCYFLDIFCPAFTAYSKIVATSPITMCLLSAMGPWPPEARPCGQPRQTSPFRGKLSYENPFMSHTISVEYSHTLKYLVIFIFNLKNEFWCQIANKLPAKMRKRNSQCNIIENFKFIITC